ncbi:MAG: hypothetical protein WCI88_16470, partial [Chloroflexota bacterium]
YLLNADPLQVYPLFTENISLGWLTRLQFTQITRGILRSHHPCAPDPREGWCYPKWFDLHWLAPNPNLLSAK